MSNRTIRWMLGGAATIFLLGAIAASALALSWSSAASTARDAASVSDVQHHALQVSHRRADSEAATAADASKVVKERFGAVSTSLEAVIEAHNHVVDVHNAAAGLFNAGRFGAASDMFVIDGEPAVAASVAQTSAAHEALTNLQTAITELEEALR